MSGLPRAVGATAFPGALHQVGWGAVGGFVSRAFLPTDCVCHCAVASGVDSAILNILEQQLSRCGPENLSAGGGWGSSALLAAGLFGFVVGGGLATIATCRLGGGPRPIVPFGAGRIDEKALAAAPLAVEDRIGELAKAQVEELRRRRHGGGR